MKGHQEVCSVEPFEVNISAFVYFFGKCTNIYNYVLLLKSPQNQLLFSGFSLSAADRNGALGKPLATK
jgi:hypothetical protein